MIRLSQVRSPLLADESHNRNHNMGVSKNQGPKKLTPNSRGLAMRISTKKTANSWKQPYESNWALLQSMRGLCDCLHPRRTR